MAVSSKTGTTFEDPRVKHREDRIKEAIAHDAALPQYKRDLRRKLLRLRDLFVHQARQVRFAIRPLACPLWPWPVNFASVGKGASLPFAPCWLTTAPPSRSSLSLSLHRPTAVREGTRLEPKPGEAASHRRGTVVTWAYFPNRLLICLSASTVPCGRDKMCGRGCGYACRHCVVDD